MGDFIIGNPALPAPKANAVAVPPGAERFLGTAEDFNGLWNAAGDVRDHTRGWVNARSYGLACDGVTDDYPALAAMLTLLGTTAATLIVPGPCVVNTSITIPTTLPVRFEGAGAFLGSGTVTYTKQAGGSAAIKNTSYSIVDRIALTWIPVEGSVSGNNNGGVSFVVTKGLTVLGVKFYSWTANITVKVTLWTRGVRRASVNVVTTAIGSYSGLFATPYTLSGAEINDSSADMCRVSCWEITGTNYGRYISLVADVARPAFPFFAGPYFITGAPQIGQAQTKFAQYWAAGDLYPNSLASAEWYYFMEPIFADG